MTDQHIDLWTLVAIISFSKLYPGTALVVLFTFYVLFPGFVSNLDVSKGEPPTKLLLVGVLEPLRPS